MAYSKHTWSHMISGPQIWFNLNVSQPHTDRDRSRILDVGYGTNSWRIILSYVKLITGYVDFKEFIEQRGGPNLDDIQLIHHISISSLFYRFYKIPILLDVNFLSCWTSGLIILYHECMVTFGPSLWFIVRTCTVYIWHLYVVYWPIA